MTTTIDMNVTLGLSNVKEKNQRAKRRPQMIGFLKVAQYHESNIWKIKKT